MKLPGDACNFVESKIGAAYVWGATGQLCTAAMLEEFRLRYYKSTSNQCPWNDGNNGYTYKERCKHWLTKDEGGDQDEVLEAYDCGGLVFDAFLGINTTSAGYYLNATIKGTINSIPKAVKGIQVFKKNSTGSIVHVGCSIGDGTVIEAKNTASGVVRTSLALGNWSLWAQCYLLDYTGGENDVALFKGQDGQHVYNYQIICKKLGQDIGEFDDMVLKDSVGKPLKTGCDGSYGPKMLTVTNMLQLKYGLPVTTDGFVSDELMGKLNAELQAQITGVPQEEYDKVVAERDAALSQVQLLSAQVKELEMNILELEVELQNSKDINEKLSKQLSDTLILLDKSQKELAEANKAIKEAQDAVQTLLAL